MDVTTVDVNEATAELTFPVNFLGLDYNEVEVTYTAGLVTVPDAVKVACAQIVKNAQATPGMNVKSSKMDTVQMEYFSGSLIDPQVQMLLRPYMQRGWGNAMADLVKGSVVAGGRRTFCCGARVDVRCCCGCRRATAGIECGEQLGLAVPEFQDVELAPVVFRKARQGASALSVTADKAARWELMVSASAVQNLVGSLGYSAASVLFATAFGVLIDGVLMEVGVGYGVGGVWKSVRLLAGAARAPLATGGLEERRVYLIPERLQINAEC